MKVLILETAEAKEKHDELGSKVVYTELSGFDIFISSEFSDNGLERVYNVTKKQAEAVLLQCLNQMGRR